MRKLLIIRFSALGDVAMLVPVVSQLAQANTDWDITVLSRKQTAALWKEMPENVHFFGADLKGQHQGRQGLVQLLKDIDYKQFDKVADMHDVLRSRFLTRRFRLAGVPVKTIRKGRWQKWLLVHRSTLVGRCMQQFLPNTLTSTISRYEGVLTRLGFSFNHGTGMAESHLNHTLITPLSHLGYKTIVEKCGVGIAPFAAHEGKIYPLDKMEEVVRQLSEQVVEPIYLFGAGDSEKAVLEDWEKKYKGVISLVGKQKMDKEIAIMRGLRLMLTMDSGNMHLASLAGTRVISIWGATHPKMGFLGYGQCVEDCIQLDLPCRPCSVYGNKVCRYGDRRCLNVEPKKVVECILAAIHSKSNN